MSTEEKEKLTKTRNGLLLGGILVGISTALKFAGLFSVGAIPPLASTGLAVILLISAGATSVKLSKME